MYRIGLDLGGTKIEAAVLDESGSVLFRERIPTEQEQGYARILSRLQHLYQAAVLHIKQAPHTLGIGTPGAFSQKTGLLKNSNTVCLNQKLSLQELQELLRHPVAVENDANCFAMAEAVSGAGAGQAWVFGVILGTGCGGGIVHQGHLVRGRQSIAGEWGHMVLDPSGPACYCGARGCVETFISGGGLEKAYEARFGTPKALQDIVLSYRNKDSAAESFMDEFFGRFGQALANVINVLDPDIVILGGGVSNIEEIYTKGIGEVRKRVFSDELTTPIVRHTLGDSAGVIGAALIGIE